MFVLILNQPQILINDKLGHSMTQLVLDASFAQLISSLMKFKSIT